MLGRKRVVSRMCCFARSIENVNRTQSTYTNSVGTRTRPAPTSDINRSQKSPESASSSPAPCSPALSFSTAFGSTAGSSTTFSFGACP